MKGPIKAKKCPPPPRCQDHVFSMRPANSAASIRQEIQMHFCPKLQSNGTVSENTYPEFNKDGKSHSPAFVLGIDKKQNIERDQEMLEEHNRRVREFTESRKQILFPKPSRKHKVCSVCRTNYDDYLEHIRSQAHKRQVRSSRFNNEILNLCMTLFNNDNKAEVVIEDEEYLSTTFENRRASGPEDAQPSPTKRRKYQDERRVFVFPQEIRQAMLPVHNAPNIPLFGYWNQQQLMQQLQHLQQQNMMQYYQSQQYAFMCSPKQLNPFMQYGMPAYGTYGFQTGAAANPIVLDQ